MLHIIKEDTVDDEIVTRTFHDSVKMFFSLLTAGYPLSSIQVEIFVCHRRAACFVP